MADPPLTPFQRALIALRGPGYTPAWLIHLAISLMSPAAWISKQLWESQTAGRAGWKLHLGCGPVYLPDWLNTEILPIWKRDCWIDLRHGLPVDNDSTEAIYANQVLEHFPLETGTALLAECHRVLQPGGVARLIVPDLGKAARALAEGNRHWFEQQQSVAPEASLQDAADEYLFCHGHHLVQFDYGLMRRTLESVGNWALIEEAAPGSNRVLTEEEKQFAESRWPVIEECCLVVEAVKQ